MFYFSLSRSYKWSLNVTFLFPSLPLSLCLVSLLVSSEFITFLSISCFILCSLFTVFLSFNSHQLLSFCPWLSFFTFLQPPPFPSPLIVLTILPTCLLFIPSNFLLLISSLVLPPSFALLLLHISNYFLSPLLILLFTEHFLNQRSCRFCCWFDSQQFRSPDTQRFG